MILLRPALLALLPLATASRLPAQIRVRAEPPTRMAGTLLLPDADEVQELGAKVEMFENPNLDRYLHRAQRFLGLEEYDKAIKLLQDVIEGRTTETLGQPGAEGRPAPQIYEDEADASEAVYAGDGRLYRPVRRLCHELLASMPPLGLNLYRQLFEVAAEQSFDEALAERDLYKLEEVYNRYFVTLSAGRAMRAAVDLQMDTGRYRSAIQILRDMMEIYPAGSRAELGISDVWLGVRSAVCLSMLGEHRTAGEVLRALEVANPDATIRLMGELSSVGELREILGSPAAQEVPPDVEYLAIRTGRETLVPLWESRFFSPDPYQVSRSTNSAGSRFRVAITDGSGGRGVPRMSDYQPGTSVCFVGDRVAFMDHYCLRVHDALSGAIVLTADEILAEAPHRRANQIHARIPLYDFGTLVVEADETRFYTVQGSAGQGGSAILANHLVAYQRATMETLWDTDELMPLPAAEGGPGYADVIFLATPTVFGNRLLAPVLHKGTYALQCVDRETGRSLWRTRVHAGGTPFLRAPGTRVGVQDGNAYFLTNAGALAAIDAYTGDLRWVRKYERLHPLRQRSAPPSRSRNTIAISRQQPFREFPLDGFVTTDMVLVDGLVVIAPSDGRVLLCVDGASGEPVWLMSRDGRYEFYGTLNHLVGANSSHLYLASNEHLLCVDLRSGTRLWAARLPQGSGSRWRGRGTVTEDLVILPGDAGLLVHDAGGRGDWWTLPLPSFSPGREPLQGESNLFLSGPYLAAVYEGGVEVYSSAAVLGELARGAAADPWNQARYLAQAGRLTAAIEVLEAWLQSEPEVAGQTRAPARMLGLAREVALAMAASGSRSDALALLDRCRPHLAERTLRHRWHLARIDVFRALQDLKSVAEEQQDLYSLMDGKG